MHRAGTLVVVNPTAGTTTAALVDDVIEVCRGHGRRPRVVRTTRPGAATELVSRAVADPPDLMIVIGGDGTVREVVTGLVTRPRGPLPTLFTVPGGTGNSGYRMMWGRQAWPDALATVLRGDAVVRRLDVAYLAEAGATALLGASAGLFAAALITARASTMRGWARYEDALATTADRFTPFPARVSVDGSVIHAGEIILVNTGGGRYRAGQYRLLPHSLVDDGLLDVCVVGAELGSRRALALARDGRHLVMPGVSYGRGSRVAIERLDGAPLCFEHDGEVLDGAERTMTLDVVPRVLPMWGARSAEPASLP